MTLALTASGSLGVALPALLSGNLGLQIDLRGRITIAGAANLALQSKLEVELAAALALQADIQARVDANLQIIAQLEAQLKVALEFSLVPPGIAFGAALQFLTTAGADLQAALQGPNLALDLAAGLDGIRASISAAIAAGADLAAQLSAAIAAVARIQANIQAEITAQLALIADLQAQLSITLGLGDLFLSAGVRVYTYDGELENLGSEATAYLAGSGADGMAGAVKGVIILTDVPASAAALGLVLGV